MCWRDSVVGLCLVETWFRLKTLSGYYFLVILTQCALDRADAKGFGGKNLILSFFRGGSFWERKCWTLRTLKSCCYFVPRAYITSTHFQIDDAISSSQIDTPIYQFRMKRLPPPWLFRKVLLARSAKTFDRSILPAFSTCCTRGTWLKMENGIKKAPKNAFPQKHRKYTCIVSCCRCGDTKSTLVILALSCSVKKTNYPKFPRVPSPESRVSLSPVGKKNRRLFILFRNLATPTLTTYLLHLAEFESLFFLCRRSFVENHKYIATW